MIHKSLLSQRLMLLNNYLKGIDLQIATIKGDIPSIAEANIERAKFIVEAEIAGTESLIPGSITVTTKTLLVGLEHEMYQNNYEL